MRSSGITFIVSASVFMLLAGSSYGQKPDYYLLDPGFDEFAYSADAGLLVPSCPQWHFESNEPASYRFTADTAGKHGGASCMKLEFAAWNADTESYAKVQQSIPVAVLPLNDSLTVEMWVRCAGMNRVWIAQAAVWCGGPGTTGGITSLNWGTIWHNDSGVTPWTRISAKAWIPPATSLCELELLMNKDTASIGCTWWVDEIVVSGGSAGTMRIPAARNPAPLGTALLVVDLAGRIASPSLRTSPSPVCPAGASTRRLALWSPRYR